MPPSHSLTPVHQLEGELVSVQVGEAQWSEVVVKGPRRETSADRISEEGRACSGGIFHGPSSGSGAVRGH